MDILLYAGLSFFIFVFAIFMGLLVKTLGAPITVEVTLKIRYFNLTTEHALRSLLSVTEDSTGKNIQELLAFAMEQGSGTVSIGDKTVDLSTVIGRELGFLIQGREYYLVAGTGPGKLEFGDDTATNYCTITMITLPSAVEEKVVSLCVE